MTAIIENNPFDLLLEIFNENYPDKSYTIKFVTDLYKQKAMYGMTLFLLDKVVVYIDSSFTINNTLFVMVHELAHVVSGLDAEHEDKWKEVETFLNTELKKRTNYEPLL